MMMKRMGMAVVGAVVCASLLTGCKEKTPQANENEGAKPAVGKTFRFNYSIFFPATHIQCKTATAWAAEVEKRSNGRIKIDMHPGGSLTSAKQVYDGVVNGVSEIGMGCFAYTRGAFPLVEALDLPLGYPNGAVATRIANEMIAKYKPAELSKSHVLYLHAHGPGIFASKKPAKTLGDIKGQKIRATGLSSKIVERLGGIPVGMSQGETVEALSKGVVEGTLCPVETLKGWKQGEAISGVTELPGIGYTTSMFAVMNLEAWNSLPADLQKVVDEVSQEWIAKQGAAWDQADTEGWAYIKELGKSHYKLSETEAATARLLVRPLLDEYVAKAKGKGLPGEQFLKDLQAAIAAAK